MEKNGKERSLVKNLRSIKLCLWIRNSFSKGEENGKLVVFAYLIYIYIHTHILIYCKLETLKRCGHCIGNKVGNSLSLLLFSAPLLTLPLLLVKTIRLWYAAPDVQLALSDLRRFHRGLTEIALWRARATRKRASGKEGREKGNIWKRTVALRGKKKTSRENERETRRREGKKKKRDTIGRTNASFGRSKEESGEERRRRIERNVRFLGIEDRCMPPSLF